MTAEVFQGVGRRKSSTARVRLMKGKGEVIVNGKPIDEFFGRETSKMIALQSIVAAGKEKDFDIKVNVKGGGISGQAGAIRLGVSRALTQFDEELRPKLRKDGFLTRDAREVERKKVGLRKARKRPQFSKR